MAKTISRSLPELDVRSLPGPETILRRELANGIVLLARENFASPSVVFSGYLTAGSIDEAPEAAGLAEMTASCLMRGTAQLTSEQISEAVESVGARLFISAGKHSTSFSGKSLREDFESLLGLFTQVIREPAFPGDQVELVRTEQLTAIAIREQETGSRAQQRFNELIYPAHPYSQPNLGTSETVKNLRTTHLKRFHKNHYGPRGMVISVVGSVESEQAADLVERHLSGFINPKQASQPGLPALKPRNKETRAYIDLEGKIQSDLVIGMAGPTRRDRAYLAAALGNNILGRFGMMGRIGERVRTRSGMAYYAYSNLNSGLGPGPWQVIAGVNPAKLEDAIEMIKKEIQRLVQSKVSADELFDNQSNFIGRLPLQLESNEGVSGALTYLERYELGLDYYQRFPSMVAEVKREQIRDTAARFLDPDRLAIAGAGPALK